MERKKLYKNIVFSFVTAFVLCTMLFIVPYADAATLQINSNSSTISVGDTVILYVVVNSEGIAINNADASIKFPSDLFDVISVGKSGSIFSLWVEEPTFSNSTGLVTFNGGLPTPGYNGSQGSVISITARAKKTGQAEFAFSSAAVRANDGLGTDVLNSQQGKILTIIKNDVPAVVAPPAQTITETQNITINSTTHPDEDRWYAQNSPAFSWDLSKSTDAVRTTITKDINELPTVTYSPAIKQKTVASVEDGIWYFKVRGRNSGVWGSTATYKVNIDATPPQIINSNFAYNDATDVLDISIDANDATSGIERYEIYVNDSIVKSLTADKVVDGKYTLSWTGSGANTAKVVVTDKAGNHTETSGTFTSTIVGSAKSTFQFPKVPALSALVALLSLLLAMFVYHERHHYIKYVYKTNMKSAVVSGNSSKVLLLLKKRVEKHLELLQKTRHNRILTKEEKEIKEALESDLDEIDKALETQKSE